jgi:hypothetical protein
MILFKVDWKNYPHAIIDTKTPNKSWVRAAGIFKAMGIENAEFCLALHNPMLQGLDPFSPDITQEQIIAITTEAKENPWYFFREIVRLPAVAGADSVPLRANRGNIALFWLFFNHITLMLIQIRQTGKSVSTDSLMVYLLCIATVNTDINLLTKDDSLRVKNIERIKEIIEELPPYFQLRDRSDTNNSEKITINALGNTYNSSVAQASEKAATNLGRGMTLAITHVDEIAYVNNIDITLPKMLAASSAARDMAAANNAHYGNIFTTTPGYLTSKSGKFAHKIYKESFRWTEKLYDSIDEDDLKETIRRNSPKGELRVIVEFNHRQLGYSDEWLKEKIQDAMSEGEDAGADFLNIWAEGNVVSPIPKQYLKLIKESKKEPYIEISKYGYITRWFIPEQSVDNNLDNRKVVMGLDTSDAVGNDDIGLVIRDASTAEVLGVGVYNETNLITFSEWIADLIQRFPNMTVVIERRSSGVAIIDNLLRILPAVDIDPFKRLFNWVVNNADQNANYRDEVVNISFSRRDPYVYTKYRREFGYATSGAGRASRDNLYGTAFMASVKYTCSATRDATLIEQITSLVRRNDRIDHDTDGHDDLVIAWLLCYWFLLEAKYKQYYGLQNNIVLSSVSMVIISEQGGQDAINHRNRQLRIKAELDGLIEELKLERNSMRAMIIQNRIKHKYKDIDTSIIQALNIETLLDNISLEKRKTMSRYR